MHNETGLLVETRNPEALAAAILDLLEHPDKAQRLATQAQERMRAHYSTEHSLECLYQAYDAGLRLTEPNAVAAQTL